MALSPKKILSNDSKKCTNCSSKHPRKDLSLDLGLCLDCQLTIPVDKCKYCRCRFRPTDDVSETCNKCQKALKKRLTPKLCRYCKIRAAFYGDKCCRCREMRKKYGPPKKCSQCKTWSAFQWDHKPLEGMDLCYLCTSSLERVVLRQKKKALTQRKEHETSLTLEESPKASENCCKESSQSEDISQSFSSDKVLPSIETSENNESLPFIENLQSSSLDFICSAQKEALQELRKKENDLVKLIAERDQEIVRKNLEIAEEKARSHTVMMEIQKNFNYMNTRKMEEMKSLNDHVSKLMNELSRLKKSSKPKPKLKRSYQEPELFSVQSEINAKNQSS